MIFTSKRRALALTSALFFIGLAILAFTDAWWPGIMLVVGVPLSLRQYLLGRLYDMCVSLLVFVGTFIVVEFDIAWRVFLPILFTLGAIYILVREFMDKSEDSEADDEDDLNHELEERRRRRK
jgi:hypothetical protein